MSEQPPRDPAGNPGEPAESTEPLPGRTDPYPPAQHPPGYGPQAQYPQAQYPPAQYQPGYGPQGYYPPVPYPPVHQVAPKNPAVSLLVSFFIPGLGSMMNGDAGKGVAILVGYVVSLLLTIILIGFIGVVAFWIWGMVDAYQGAREWNLRHGIVS